jgi:hypothetical protein
MIGAGIQNISGAMGSVLGLAEEGGFDSFRGSKSLMA